MTTVSFPIHATRATTTCLFQCPSGQFNYKKPEKASDSFRWAVTKWTSGSQETFSRILKAVSLSLKLTNQLRANYGKLPLSGSQATIDEISTVRGWLGWPCLPMLWSDAKESVLKFKNISPDSTPDQKTALKQKLVGDVGEAISATWGSVGPILAQVPQAASFCGPMGNLASCAGGSAEIAGVFSNLDNLKVCGELLKPTGNSDLYNEGVETLKGHRTTYLLKSASKIAASVGAVFSLIAFVVGAPLLSVATGLAVALAGSLTGIAAKAWEAYNGKAPDFRFPQTV